MSEKKFECPICHKCFTTEKYRDVHINGHNGQKEYQCKVCEKTFLSKSHLTEHMKFHNEHSKKFLCSECGQRFIRNDYLVIHMRRHRGEKPFKCKYCGKGKFTIFRLQFEWIMAVMEHDKLIFVWSWIKSAWYCSSNTGLAIDNFPHRFFWCKKHKKRFNPSTFIFSNHSQI